MNLIPVRTERNQARIEHFTTYYILEEESRNQGYVALHPDDVDGGEDGQQEPTINGKTDPTMHISWQVHYQSLDFSVGISQQVEEDLDTSRLGSWISRFFKGVIRWHSCSSRQQQPES